jgi:hypothetical protein
VTVDDQTFIIILSLDNILYNTKTTIVFAILKCFTHVENQRFSIINFSKVDALRKPAFLGHETNEVATRSAEDEAKWLFATARRQTIRKRASSLHLFNSHG